MANVNIKFNGKDFLLSCDDGQEEHLEELLTHINKKFSNLKNDLGNIGENKLLLITSVQIMDEYFETKKKVKLKKTELKNLSDKFRELRSLVYDYKDQKEGDIKQLSQDHEDFKKEIEKNKEDYEKIIEAATDEIESFVEKANLENLQFSRFVLKSKLRNKILKIRENNYKNNIKINFNQIIKLLKKEKITKKIVGGYYPVNFEVDDLELLKRFEKNKFKISLPVIKKNFQMDFYSWSFSDLLRINKYGIPEPETKNMIYPDILLIPLVAFDKNLNRLGYGGGYYDRLIKKISKKKKIIKIGYSIKRNR